MIKLNMPSHLNDRIVTAMNLLLNSGIKNTEWSLGGGSALEMMLNHRESEDVDIFVYNPQLTTMLSPRLNSETEGLEYDESSSHLKLFMPDYQIDIICTSNLTDRDDLTMAIGDSEINIEHPLEILTKKLFYRSASLKFRDVFDIVASVDAGIVDNSDIENTINEMGNKIEPLRSRLIRLDAMTTENVERSVRELNVKPAFQSLAMGSIEIFSTMVYNSIKGSESSLKLPEEDTDIGLK